MNLLEEFGWKLVEANAEAACCLSLVKVSRQSSEGQMEIGGKRKRKMNGVNEKSR
jgi:hypothetical protein